MTELSKVHQAAQQLREAAISGKTCAPVRDLIGANAIDDAYEVQKINTQLELKNGRKLVGAKIGLTSFSVQKQLGVDQPDYGVLYADTHIENAGSIAAKSILQPKVEAEIAFILKSDLNQDNIALSDVQNAVDYVVSAIEIVGSRIEAWNIKIVDTIADNASASHFVLGNQKMKLEQIDLVNCKMQMTKNGETVSEGMGKACMDNPLNAALWLAQTMQKLGTPLKAGEIILSGALGPMANVESGDFIEAKIDGFDTVSVKFS